MFEDEGAGREKEVRRIKRGSKRVSQRVKVDVRGKKQDLYCDTGSNITIDTPARYKKAMGKVVAVRSYLRARGLDGYLDTKGMFKTALNTSSGATKMTWEYVVAGARPEPLQGDHDAEDPGNIRSHPEGRPHQGSDDDDKNDKDEGNVSTTAKLRKTDKKVINERRPKHRVKTKGKEETTRVVNGYKRPVLRDRKGKMKKEEIELKNEDRIKPVQPAGYPAPQPVQPARYPAPHQHQKRQATHLRKLEEEGVVEQVADPTQARGQGQGHH